MTIDVAITPEETSHIYADDIKATPNAVYGVSQESHRLGQKVCCKGDGDVVSVASATMEPNLYDTIDCLKQI